MNLNLVSCSSVVLTGCAIAAHYSDGADECGLGVEAREWVSIASIGTGRERIEDERWVGWETYLDFNPLRDPSSASKLSLFFVLLLLLPFPYLTLPYLPLSLSSTGLFLRPKPLRPLHPQPRLPRRLNIRPRRPGHLLLRPLGIRPSPLPRLLP